MSPSQTDSRVLVNIKNGIQTTGLHRLASWVKETTFPSRLARQHVCISSHYTELMSKMLISNPNSWPRRLIVGVLLQDMQVTKDHCVCGSESTFDSRHLNPWITRHYPCYNTETPLLASQIHKMLGRPDRGSVKRGQMFSMQSRFLKWSYM